jgi:hypothetical protein
MVARAVVQAGKISDAASAVGMAGCCRPLGRPGVPGRVGAARCASGVEVVRCSKRVGMARRARCVGVRRCAPVSAGPNGRTQCVAHYEFPIVKQ